MTERTIIHNPTKAQLTECIGKQVWIVFHDGKQTTGRLGYTDEFSEKYGWRKLNYFTIHNWDFKASHVKEVEVLFNGHS